MADEEAVSKPIPGSLKAVEKPSDQLICTGIKFYAHTLVNAIEAATRKPLIRNEIVYN